MKINKKKSSFLKLIAELLTIIIFLEIGFNYIDLNYEPFDRFIYPFTSLFEKFGVNKFLTIFISAIIAILYLIISAIFKTKEFIRGRRLFISNFIIFSFSFISSLYLFQIFDLPRSYLLLICLAFIPINVIFNYLNSNAILVIVPFLLVSLIYISQVILPVDKLSNFVKTNYANITIINPEVNIENHLDRPTLYKLNNEIYFKKELFFKDSEYVLNVFNVCCGEFDFYKQNMRNVGYLESYEGTMYMVNGFGDMFYFDLSNMFENKATELVPVKTNIKEVINNKNIYTQNKISFSGQESIKGFQIYKDKIYISYIEDTNTSCVTLGLLYSELNSSNINFEKLLNFNQCIERENAKVQVSGGKMLFKDDLMYLTVGDFGQSSYAQDPESIFGKVLKISLINKEWETVSLGHRNPQGLEFTNLNNILIETEHGARYGDEINIINIDKQENFGNPISSYSVHYGDLTGKDIYIEDQPFNKSHDKFGFKEPIYVWGPDMPGGRNGVVDIIKNYYEKNESSFFVASLSAGYLYEIDIDLSEYKLNKINAYNIGSRIRDIEYHKESNVYFLMLENPPEIALFSRDS